MPDKPNFERPRDEARALWRSCLSRAWIEFEQAIPEEERRKLARLPLRQCTDFLSVLGAATSPDAVRQAIAAHPEAALRVLNFATMLDEHYEQHPDQFYQVKIGKLVDPRNSPMQFFAASVQDTLERYAEIHEPLPPQ
ncbi:MAG TPA: hypothetical protein VJU77_11105 [Chthoniobacterales bacterium]|nr:hypothetical protein [Chthoniobacterales bacterium]